MAHFLLYFRFSGFRSSFFPLFQPIFFRFSALWVGSRFLFPVFFPAVADIWRVSGRRHSRPLSRPFYAFLFFFTSFRASFRAFSGRAGFSGAPFSGILPESLPAFFRRLFFSSPPALIFPEKARPLPRACRMPLRRVLLRRGAIFPAGRLFIPRRGQSLSEAFFCGFCHFPPQGILPPLPGHTFYIRRKL